MSREIKPTTTILSSTRNKIVMKITKTFNWNRRDFSYDAKCEHCNHEQKNNTGGYDDSFYYNNVIPDKKCSKCGESTNSKESSEPKSVIIPKYNQKDSF